MPGATVMEARFGMDGGRTSCEPGAADARPGAPPPAAVGSVKMDVETNGDSLSTRDAPTSLDGAVAASLRPAPRLALLWSTARGSGFEGRSARPWPLSPREFRRSPRPPFPLRLLPRAPPPPPPRSFPRPRPDRAPAPPSDRADPFTGDLGTPPRTGPAPSSESPRTAAHRDGGFCVTQGRGERTEPRDVN